jgi:hypothetical protein
LEVRQEQGCADRVHQILRRQPGRSLQGELWIQDAAVRRHGAQTHAAVVRRSNLDAARQAGGPADLRRVVAVPDYPGSAWPATDEIYNDFIICDMMTKTATGAMTAEESVKSLSRSALRPISFAATSSGARSWPARRSPASRWRSPITSSSIASSPASPAALSNRLRPPPLITAPAIVQPSGAYRVLICDASDSKPNTEHSRSIWPSRQPLAFAPSSGDREGPA